MNLNSDFAELLSLFNQHGVKYLVIGGYAFGAHVEPRYTKDLDLWIEPTPTNANKVYVALKEFGAPLNTVRQPTDLICPEHFYRMGKEPVQVDILCHLVPLSFAECYDRRVSFEFGQITVPFLSKDDLIRNKLAAGRPQDLVDAKTLQDSKKWEKLPDKRLTKKSTQSRDRSRR